MPFGFMDIEADHSCNEGLNADGVVHVLVVFGKDSQIRIITLLRGLLNLLLMILAPDGCPKVLRFLSSYC